MIDDPLPGQDDLEGDAETAEADYRARQRTAALAIHSDALRRCSGLYPLDQFGVLLSVGVTIASGPLEQWEIADALRRLADSLDPPENDRGHH